MKYTPERVEAKFQRINKLLGINLPVEEMVRIMNRLGIPAEEQGETFVVFPPSNRRDITSDSDLAEEIARIYGYNNIPITNPRSPLSSGLLNKKSVDLRKIREAMRKSGFTEVINFSFMGVSGLDLIEIPDSDRRRKTVSISNPLNQDECLLRTTLIPSLITNLTYNLDRGMKDIRLFEISKIFEATGKDLPLEELRLGGILYKEKYPALWKDDAPGFFIAKGALEAMFEELKITGLYVFTVFRTLLPQGSIS